MVIDLHTHTFQSDGVLLPSELIRRAAVQGYHAIALTDHADETNFEELIEKTLRTAIEWNKEEGGIRVLAGVELTHVPPSRIPNLTERCRKAGAQVVVVHGETIVEPVAPGTNRAAIEGGVDILGHPGVILEEDVELAAQRGVHLEISARKGHCLGNGRVVTLGRHHGAKLVIDSDAHEPGDLLTEPFAMQLAEGAGLTLEEYDECEANSLAIVEKALPPSGI